LLAGEHFSHTLPNFHQDEGQAMIGIDEQGYALLLFRQQPQK